MRSTVRQGVHRVYGVVNKRLSDRKFIAKSSSIADMAVYSWIVPYERQGQKLEDFPHLKRWLRRAEREAVESAYREARRSISPRQSRRESRGILFGETAAVAR